MYHFSRWPQISYYFESVEMATFLENSRNKVAQDSIQPNDDSNSFGESKMSV